MLSRFHVIAVAGIAVVGAVAVFCTDYYMQAKRAMDRGETYDLSMYVGTISGRVEAAKAEKMAEAREAARKKAWRQGALTLLPEAPEGWVRRSLTDDESSMVMSEDVLKMVPRGLSDAASPMMRKMKSREAEDRLKEMARNGWVYERGDEVIWLEAGLSKAASSNSLAGMIATQLDNQAFGLDSQEAGFGVFDGVAFIEELDLDGNPVMHYRVLRAQIGFGDEVGIKVHAFARPDTTRELLGQIDFAAMNDLLPVPFESIADGITDGREADKEMALDMARMRKEFLALKSMDAEYRMRNIDATALVTNTMVAGYTGQDGVMDLTGGKTVDLSALIDNAYRNGLHDLVTEGRAQARKTLDSFVEELKFAMTESPDDSKVDDQDGNRIRTAQGLRLDTDEPLAAQMERIRGLPAGDCYELASQKVVCGQVAEHARETDQKAAAEYAAAAASRSRTLMGKMTKFFGAPESQVADGGTTARAAPEIKVNRSGGIAPATTVNSRGTCTMQGAVKRCKVGSE